MKLFLKWLRGCWRLHVLGVCPHCASKGYSRYHCFVCYSMPVDAWVWAVGGLEELWHNFLQEL